MFGWLKRRRKEETPAAVVVEEEKTMTAGGETTPTPAQEDLPITVENPVPVQQKPEQRIQISETISERIDRVFFMLEIKARFEREEGKPFPFQIEEELLIREMDELAARNINAGSFPGEWQQRVEKLATYDHDLTLRVVRGCLEEGSQTAKVLEGKDAVFQFIYDNMVRAVINRNINLLALDDEAMVKHAVRTGESEDEIEEELTVALYEMARMFQKHDHVFAIQWERLLEHTAQVDPVVAGEAALRVLKERAEKAVTPKPAVNLPQTPQDVRDQVNLAPAFKAAHSASMTLAERGYYHPAAEMAFDIHRLAAQCQLPPNVQTGFRNHMGGILGLWKQSVEGRTEEQGRPVAEKALADFMVARGLSFAAPEKKPEAVPPPASPSP